MSTPFKIRLLLFLLTLSFAATAITISLTFHKEEILERDARIIEKRLQQKENYVKSLLTDPQYFQSLKSLDRNGEAAIHNINKLCKEQSIFLYTYRNGRLEFWGETRIVPETDAGLKEGVSLTKWQNGWYEAIKRSDGAFSAVCYIPIKSSYPFQNQYGLVNKFSSRLISTSNLDIANLTDKQVYNIRNAEGKYLFSVKLKSAITTTFYSKLELWMWCMAVLFACIFMNYLCTWIVSKGHPKTAILILFAYFLTLRLVSLQFNWFSTYFDITIFDPRYFADNFFFPSIGDFLLNLIASTWFLSFVYTYRFQIKLSKWPLNTWVSAAIFLLMGIFISLVAVQVNDIFYGLITNSNINFDLSNILNLNWFSWLGVVLLCITVLNLYLIVEIVLVISRRLNLTNKQRVIIFLSGILLITIVRIGLRDFNFFYLLFFLIIFIRGWYMFKTTPSFNLGIFVFTVLIFAIISSLKLSVFQYQKERESRKIIAQKLESSDDPNTVLLFFNLEKEILKDDLIIDFFNQHSQDNGLLSNKLQRFYFDGYLSRYDFKTFEYDADGNSLNNGSTLLSHFKNLVFTGSIKVSEYFYRVNNTFGIQNYFALLPIQQGGRSLGTLVIELKSKAFDDPNSFPKVLIDGKIDDNDIMRNYSYAFYDDGKLVNQYGKYVYSLVNTDFPGKLKEFVFTDSNGYSHLLYQTSGRKLIVVSHANINWLMQIASVSFFFLVLLFFAGIIVSITWLWNHLRDFNFIRHTFTWKDLLSQTRILYKTRIQASMVMVVVATLLLVGVITYVSISIQYRDQQEEALLGSINKIVAGFEKQLFSNGELAINEQIFNAFADGNAVDLEYYDTEGRLLYTTQPKIYEYSLISPRMDALTYIHLAKFQQSEYVNYQHIGSMYYLAAYKPIRNKFNETVAYLGLPYYSNIDEYESRIGQFLNTIINVYALVFVAIGFFAVFMANQITYPLTLIEQSLNRTRIGRKNEPLTWHRNDEIGSLIQEYNNMIEALEESAQKLARSEREIAWKEMAKQVAHEIKNPLTPLKLGVQLLEKSYKENDPNFNKKFEKFSKSFIEQIESLSHIASEFSNFAKMPETSLEEVDLNAIIEKSLAVYQQVEHVNITLNAHKKQDLMVKGDKDQLLRCFNNLIKNGIEAIPEGREGSIRIDIVEDKNLAKIAIHDNGNGIPEGLRERIFTPNFTTKTSGTGLGLAFVKQAIENMQGSVHFKTEAGKGTTFFITLVLAS
ncbi:HAMP domain-containing protein [Pedobacter sp. BS3]|uniref:sensor histidine kinase n=1 Tax=Pedobacter sp. BS3 TaxID=2567937 RepID=UPI0011ED62F9|nr:HAMP domain-containing sensor histidine kinase [Pedobacter sp. BS3]TZF82092.1 HAMP domain-containing protein [Pedobacter sp. BS3]